MGSSPGFVVMPGGVFIERSWKWPVETQGGPMVDRALAIV